ncbi:MAG: alkaline phosphatase family protein [Aeromicrobium sp.]
MRARFATAAALTCTLLAACNHDEPTVKVAKPAPAPSTTTASPTPSESPSESPLGDTPSVATGIDKVLVVVVENKSYSQMKAKAPRIWSLAQKYAYATDFKAIVHPSLPNYIAMASGSTLGVKSNGFPGGIRLKQPSVFGNTIQAGGTAKIWADGMGPENCRPTETGKYVPRHVPWNYYVNERELCKQFVVDADAFGADVASGDLATVGMLIPDNCNNAHDCSIPTADDWIAGQVEIAMSGPDWKSGRLLIIVTADEDDKNQGNRILTVAIHPSQKSNVVTSPLTLYSLHRLLAEVGNTEPMNEGRNAPDMAEAFGLPLA